MQLRSSPSGPLYNGPDQSTELASRSLSRNDVGKLLVCRNTPGGIQFTIPAQADVAWEAGDSIEACRINEAVIFTGAPGVTLRDSGSSTINTFRRATLTRIGLNEWLLSGGLV